MFSDDALSAHESELDRMKGFYADNAAVFKLVAKREKLWKQWLDFESKAGDPTRLFNDRGGKLQKELKQRNSVSKELPKVSRNPGISSLSACSASNLILCPLHLAAPLISA